MSFPQITEEVFEARDVREKRKLAESAMQDWLEALALESLRAHVLEPDDLPDTYVNDVIEQVWDYADPIHRTEQDLYLWAGTDFQQDWLPYNREAA